MNKLLLCILWSSLNAPVPSDNWVEFVQFDDTEVLSEADLPGSVPFHLTLKRLQYPTLRKSKHIGFLESDFFKCFEVVFYPAYPILEFKTPYRQDTEIIFPFHEFT